MTSQEHLVHGVKGGDVPSKPSREAELATVPMQLYASQVYVPRQHVPSSPEMMRCISPGFSSSPSLYHFSTG